MEEKCGHGIKKGRIEEKRRKVRTKMRKEKTEKKKVRVIKIINHWSGNH